MESTETNIIRIHDNLILVNAKVLLRQLQLRGKSPSALREARVSYETIHRIENRQPIAARTFRNVVVQLTKWPVLEGAEELLES